MRDKICLGGKIQLGRAPNRLPLNSRLLLSAPQFSFVFREIEPSTHKFVSATPRYLADWTGLMLCFVKTDPRIGALEHPASMRLPADRVIFVPRLVPRDPNPG